MTSFRQSPDLRRKVYLALVGSIESQLRDAYAKRHESGGETQARLARKLGVSRSVVNRRLTGQQNITLETLADLVWALGNCIEVDIFEPAERPDKNYLLAPIEAAPIAPRVLYAGMPELSPASDSASAQLELVH